MITVIGSINLDLITTVERLPGRGETVSGGTFHTAPGGKGANQALAARRAGASVRLVGAVGRDAFAGEALALLESGGVDLESVQTTGAATGTALIMVGGDGENMIAVTPGANFAVGPASVAALVFDAGEQVVLQHEVPLATVEAALDAARAAGAVALLNTAPYRADAAPLLGKADILIANETEFDLYASLLRIEGAERGARIAAMAARLGNTIVVTLGAEGVVVAGRGGDFALPAWAIRPVDTVGAGDTFCGYLAAGLGAGLDLQAAVARAGMAATLACLKAGAQPAIPTAAEVDGAMGE